jgi:capping protein beta
VRLSLSSLRCHVLFLIEMVQELQVCMDKESVKEYILCEYNRDADSYRSPWSNKYDPPLEDGTVPSEEMRNLEVEANDVFSVYRDQYYEGGISSVYIWEDEDESFIACFLIKKDGEGKRGHMQIGSWDAIHVIQVGPEEEGAAHYCLNSTVMLSLTTDNKQSGTFNLSGSIRRQMSMTLAVADGHLVNMGKMIEEMEGKLRNSLDQVTVSHHTSKKEQFHI